MTDKTSIRHALDTAKLMTAERLKRSPTYGPYKHALDQISLIEAAILDNGVPNNEQKNAIDIGPMAVKELDDTDPRYSDALCRLSYLYKML